MFNRLQSLVAHPFAPAIFFFSGVTVDSLTLTQIDSLLDDLILFSYLAVVGLLIVLTYRAEFAQPAPTGGVIAETTGGKLSTSASEKLGGSAGGEIGWRTRLRSYYPMGIHFFLGSLFSAQSIFYLQSASLTSTALFLIVLMVFLVANEFLLERMYGVRLLVVLYTLVAFSFITFFLPVLTGIMNTAIFLLGAILSAGVAWWVVHLIHRGTERWSRKQVLAHSWPAIGVVVLLVGFYFLNWIPPVPLSLKAGGIYHQVVKEAGVYQLSFERAPWYEFWKHSDGVFHGEGPAYCFAAVYAPIRLKGTIYHHWQHRPPGGKRFSTTDRIGMPISGGRAGGYRGSTVKQHLAPGDWRVDVETDNRRIIGRISFQVEAPENGPPELDTVID